MKIDLPLPLYHTHTTRLARALISGTLFIAPVLIGIVAIAVAINASVSVARLFGRMGADWLSQTLASGASVGLLLALMALLNLANKPQVRALALVFTTAWLPIVTALVALEAALSSTLVAVPAALQEAGRALAALLGGLALVPCVSIVVAARATQNESEIESLARYVGLTSKAVLLIATSAATLAFGLRRSVPLEVALFVCVVLESAFLYALLRSRHHRVHAVALVICALVLALVAVETLSTLSGLSSLPELARIGEALYLLTPAAGLTYVVAARLSDREPTRAASVASEHAMGREDETEAETEGEREVEAEAIPEPVFLNGNRARESRKPKSSPF